MTGSEPVRPSPADLQYLNDCEMHDLVAKAQEKARTTIRRERRTRGWGTPTVQS